MSTVHTCTSVFPLPGDKLKILTALIHQLMTYVACRDVIEENFETLRTTRNDLRQLQSAENRREKDEAQFWFVQGVAAE